MSSISNIIYYSVLLSFAIYFGSKLLQFFFLQSNEQKENSKTNQKDFDLLIEQKAQYLRVTQAGALNPQSEKKEISAGNKKTNSLNIEGSPYLKTLMEDLKWGEGVCIREFKDQIYQQFKVNLPMTDVSSLLKEFLSLESCVDFLNKHLKILEQFKIYFLSYAYLKIMSQKMSQALGLKTHFYRSYCFVMLTQIKSLMEIIVDLKDDSLLDQFKKLPHKTVSQICVRLIFTSKVPYYRSYNELEQTITAQIEQTNYLDVFPDTSKGDLDSALKLFAIHEVPKHDELKSLYKELALACHPDRVPANAPAILKELANRNFINLSRAYEVLGQKG